MDRPDVPEPMVERVRRICASLPETTERCDRSAYAFEIRRKVVAYLLAPDDGNGRAIPMLAVRAEADERRALAATGHPFFLSQAGPERLGILLDDGTDWDEIGELITDSYRMLAPKKLSAMLDG